jgi:D-xylose 1-dehydrogenase (NADP+, D-xylono-1,5-lactone-forming)
MKESLEGKKMGNNRELLKLAVVGCGEISHEHFKAAKEIPGVKITACCDIQEVRAKACAEQYQCEYYNSIEKMLACVKPDGVILCTWPMQHLEQIRTCLEIGVKNILCEKSLTLSFQEAAAIKESAEKHGASVMEGCKYRFYPAIHKLEDILKNGGIGKVDSLRAAFSNYEPADETQPENELNWRYRRECGGGVAYDWVSYLVNACNYFSGGVPKRVFAAGTQSRKYEIITRLFGMIEYDNGVTAYIESSKDANFTEEFQINCANGILRLPVAWGIFGDVTITQTHRKPAWDYILTDRFEVGYQNAFVLQLQNFAEVVRGQTTPAIPLEQSVRNIAVIEALVSSLSQHRAIDLPAD